MAFNSISIIFFQQFVIFNLNWTTQNVNFILLKEHFNIRTNKVSKRKFKAHKNKYSIIEKTLINIT